MKRLMIVTLFAITMALTAGPAIAGPNDYYFAPDEYDELQSHPLRVAAYLVYPVGFTAEWLIFRPFHYLVSRPSLAPVFGHRPHEELGGYSTYK